MNFNLTRFRTLMQREWLQNRWTWLIAVAALPLIALITMPFGTVGIGPSGGSTPATSLMLLPWAMTALVCATIAWLTTLFSAASLARRDAQDRSIEFWLSLPSAHGEHFAAQYLTHALLFPMGALAVGLVLGLPLALTVVVKVLGAASLGAVDWAAVLSGLAGAVPAALLALLVAAVWLAPLVLLIMAASAWLKRLGIPALVVAAIALYNLPLTRGAVRPLWNAYGAGIEQIMQGAIGVFLTSSLPNLKIDGDGLAGVEMSLAQFLAKLGSMLASPLFGLCLLIAAACFWALVERRRRAV